MAQDQARQHLGTSLRDRPRKGGGRGRSGLAGRDQQDRHASQNGGLKRVTAFGRKSHRGHDMAAHSGAERPLAVLAVATSDSVKHRLHRAHRCAVGVTDGNRLCGARQAGIGGVHIKVEDGLCIPRHDRAMIPVDIVQPIHQSGNVVKVSHRAFTVAAGFEIHDRRGRAARASVDALATDFDVMDRINAVQGKRAPRTGDHVFDQCTRKAHPTIPIHPAPCRHGAGFKAGGQLRQAEVFQKLQRQFVDPQNLSVRQRLVASADKARWDR